MPKVAMNDVYTTEKALKDKLQIIINAINAQLPKPDYFSVDDAISVLSEPEVVGSLASEAYPKMYEFEESCNETNCEPEVLDNVGLYAFYKIYNEWPETELEAELIKNLKF